MERDRRTRSREALSSLVPLAGRVVALAIVRALLAWLVIEARVVGRESERRERAGGVQEESSPSLLVPIRGVAVTELRDSFSDPRDNGRRHRAIDIPARRGALVVAADAGRVRRIFSSPTGGLGVYQIDRDGTRCFYYAHLDRYESGLREGLFLNRGDRIGYVGTTGNAEDDAPHLHFAVRVLGERSERCAEAVPANPFELFRNVLAGP